MKKLLSHLAITLFVLLGASRAANAQMDETLIFTTTFPFFAGNAKMPPGTYRVSQLDMTISLLDIEAEPAGKFAAVVGFIPTQSDHSHRQSDVVFKKYGNHEYLSKLWTEGERYGVEIEPTRAEKIDAAKVAASEHSVPTKHIKKH